MEPTTKTRIMKWLSAILLAVLVGILVYAGCFAEPGTGESYIKAAENFRERLEKKVAEPGNRVSRFVDYAHRTVTVKKVEVVKCLAVTTDGSDTIADGFGNLVRFEVEYRVTWDGWLQKNGETVVGCSYEPKKGKLKSTPLKVLRTNAKYTRDKCL